MLSLSSSDISNTSLADLSDDDDDDMFDHEPQSCRYSIYECSFIGTADEIARHMHTDYQAHLNLLEKSLELQQTAKSAAQNRARDRDVQYHDLNDCFKRVQRENDRLVAQCRRLQAQVEEMARMKGINIMTGQVEEEDLTQSSMSFIATKYQESVFSGRTRFDPTYAHDAATPPPALQYSSRHGVVPLILDSRALLQSAGAPSSDMNNSRNTGDGDDDVNDDNELGSPGFFSQLQKWWSPSKERRDDDDDDDDDDDRIDSDEKVSTTTPTKLFSCIEPRIRLPWMRHFDFPSLPWAFSTFMPSRNNAVSIDNEKIRPLLSRWHHGLPDIDDIQQHLFVKVTPTMCPNDETPPESKLPLRSTVATCAGDSIRSNSSGYTHL